MPFTYLLMQILLKLSGSLGHDLREVKKIDELSANLSESLEVVIRRKSAFK